MKRGVQIELRCIHHGVDLPIPGIHDDHGNRLRPLLLHDLVSRLLRILLDIDVQTHSQGIPGNRLHPLLRSILQFRTLCVGKCQDQSISALQILLVHDLQTNDPLIVRPCKAQNLRGQTPVGVIPLIILVNFHTGKSEVHDLVPQ